MLRLLRWDLLGNTSGGDADVNGALTGGYYLEESLRRRHTLAVHVRYELPFAQSGVPSGRACRHTSNGDTSGRVDEVIALAQDLRWNRSGEIDPNTTPLPRRFL